MKNKKERGFLKDLSLREIITSGIVEEIRVPRVLKFFESIGEDDIIYPQSVSYKLGLSLQLTYGLLIALVTNKIFKSVSVPYDVKSGELFEKNLLVGVFEHVPERY